MHHRPSNPLAAHEYIPVPHPAVCERPLPGLSLRTRLLATVCARAESVAHVRNATHPYESAGPRRGSVQASSIRRGFDVLIAGL